MQIRYIDRSTGKIKTESPPAEGLIKFLYGNPLGRATVLPLVKQKFISAWYGRRMDAPASKKNIPDFVESLGIDLGEAQKTLPEFTSFNDFFYRKLKPGARPVASGLVSPGDGRLLAFEQVGDVHQFYVKGQPFTLTDFLQDEALAREFSGAAMLILRLAPNDYHRYHFPYAGIPTASKDIQGAYYSVSPHALVHNFTRVFCENKRKYCCLRTGEKGDMLLAPVGAAMVGTIIDTYEPETPCAAGDEMGYFAFGGSSLVVLVDPKHFTIDADLLQNTRDGLETFVRMGERIGG